ncbi:DNA-binding SARP family transcriptional activator [Stackebrandtia albiflava]|uniref:DNA-binding SARP family transcriptional activator n=1 Tax=Stackebrandtia albiflava TaxID=406432 RepID=A0A562V300_9ACTN|nr:BTAD domain-containing putative transcriptional regulator [Stackebrandtia albiflava]TWJ12279.1 DNA-binding SARP family transcriptional activator [Stackebrandtia albiflava]
MEFRILGPVEVVRSGVEVPLRGRHHPRLLALLLANASRPVPLDRLIRALWDDDPPTTARQQVQNIVGGLRRQLPDAAIHTVPQGYRLDVPARRLDLLRCRELVASAHRLRDAGNRVAAAERLAAAQSEWRGPSLAGVTGQIMTGLAGQLDELRLTITQERIDIDLELGRHGELLEELWQLVAEHPLRQPFVMRLMLALHRAGRTPEALTVYSDAAGRLADQLGIDPAPSLRDLHTAILRQDDSIDVRVPAPAVGPVPALGPVPAQLPAASRAFTGRDAELAALDGLLDGPDSVALLTAIGGGGGIGKTALAVHWGYRRRDRFPDGQLYADLRGFGPGEPVDPYTVVTRFLRALGVRGDGVPADLDEATALFRSLVDGRRMLILLDNARDVAQVRPLLPGVAGPSTVVTSRAALPGLIALDDARPIRLDTLTDVEADRLITGLVGDTRLEAEPAAARELVSRCGGLPLALRIAAAILLSRPDLSLSRFVAELAGPQRLTALSVPGDPEAAIAATFDASYVRLEPDTAALFLALGLLPGDDFDAGLAAAAGGIDESVAAGLLARLADGHLVERHRDDTFRMHDLVRAYARQRAETTWTPAAREAQRDRIVDHYFQSRGVVAPGRYENLMATYREYADHPQRWHLVAGFRGHLVNGHGARDILAACEEQIRAVTAGHDPQGVEVMTSYAAAAAWSLGEMGAAIRYAREAAAIATDPWRRDMELSNLALYLYVRGDYREAERITSDTLERTDRDTRPYEWASQMGRLGNIYRVTGRYDRALECNDAALGFTGTTPELRLSHTIARGLLYCDLGNTGPAKEAFKAAFAMPGIAENHRLRVLAMSGRAELAAQAGRHDEAVTEFAAAIEICRREQLMAHYHELGSDMAVVLTRLGRAGEAVDVAEAAWDFHRRAEHRNSEAIAGRSLCVAYTASGDATVAVEYGEAAVRLFEAGPNPLWLSRSLTDLAAAFDAAGEADEARRRRSRAASILRRLGDANRVPIVDVAAADASAAWDAAPREGGA